GQPVPAVVRGYLRQEEASVAAAADGQTIPSNLDLPEIRDLLDRSHDRDLEAEALQFSALQREEARVAEGRVDGARGYGLEQRFDGAETPDTSPQVALPRG